MREKRAALLVKAVVEKRAFSDLQAYFERALLIHEIDTLTLVQQGSY